MWECVGLKPLGAAGKAPKAAGGDAARPVHDRASAAGFRSHVLGATPGWRRQGRLARAAQARKGQNPTHGWQVRLS